MKTLTENVLCELALPLVTSAAARQGPTIDVRGYVGCAIVLHFGPAASGLTHTVRVQGSSDDATWKDLVGPEWAAATSATDLVGVLDITHSRFRYLRVVVEAGGTGDLTLGALAYKYNGKRYPAAYVAGMFPLPFRYHAPEAAAN